MVAVDAVIIEVLSCNNASMRYWQRLRSPLVAGRIVFVAMQKLSRHSATSSKPQQSSWIL
jgi:hypothetical protein